MKNESVVVNDQKFLIPLDTENKKFPFGRFPYENKDPLALMDILGIEFPFSEVIDKKKTGSSYCDVCGRKYKGYQLKCTTRRKFWAITELVGSRLTFKHLFLTRKKAKEYSVGRNIIGKPVSKVDRCNGKPKWDFVDEFNEQKRFFDSIGSLLILSDKIKSGSFESFLKYNACFPDGIALLVETEYLREKINRLEECIGMLTGEDSDILS